MTVLGLSSYSHVPQSLAQHSMGDPSNRQVSNLLHTLRGEHFRHQQNVRKVHGDDRAYVRTYNARSLPFDLRNLDLRGSVPSAAPQRTWSGPTPPVSWQPRFSGVSLDADASERAHMLSLMLSRLPSVKPDSTVPPLALVCLQLLMTFSFSSKDELAQILAVVPPHLRLQLVQKSALTGIPLPNNKLYAMCGAEGHIDGELIIMGPMQTIRTEYFRLAQTGEQPDGAWDSAQEWTTIPFHTLILMSVPLQAPTMLSFPRTLTHLGLINMQTSLSLHRLPSVCPLLVMLDLSFNKWLHEFNSETVTVLERVPWSRWKDLRVLGMRECHVPSTVRIRINEGRWDDVEIVQ